MQTDRRVKWLNTNGYRVEQRDPHANTDHAGDFMVIDADTYSILRKTDLTFKDASELDNGFCVVGSKEEVIQGAYDFLFSMEG